MRVVEASARTSATAVLAWVPNIRAVGCMGLMGNLSMLAANVRQRKPWLIISFTPPPLRRRRRRLLPLRRAGRDLRPRALEVRARDHAAARRSTAGRGAAARADPAAVDH